MEGDIDIEDESFNDVFMYYLEISNSDDEAIVWESNYRGRGFDSALLRADEIKILTAYAYDREPS